MTGLPKLPGLSFKDPTINKFQVCQTFSFINGYPFPKNPTEFSGIGGKELDINSVKYIKNQDPIRFDPSLTYGRTRGPAAPQFVPHFAHYDKKCLTFKAFFKQGVIESPNEHYRVRQVNIIYFLEDDSITVMEPFVRNCGFKQGRLIKRGRIPKSDIGDFWHWKDLNVGKDFCFYGTVFHTVDTDGFTREYMASQGIVINPTEDMPPDPYIQMREMKVAPQTRVTPPLDDKLRRFLEYDGKILKFNAVWDNRDAEYGELKDYVILYFLCDDTISVKEIHTENDGCDPCSLLLRKTKLPKNWTDRPITYASCYLEISDAEVTEYYQPKDFVVGNTVFVLGRRFLLYDCDPFTRTYYSKVLNIVQGPPMDVLPKKKSTHGKCMPPHGELGIGTIEDSLQNVFMTLPTRPKVDEIRMVTNANKYLRYSMVMDWVHPEDEIRKFILLYTLSDGTCKIHEPAIRNSGILGGKFLQKMHLKKPNTHPYNPEFYTPCDFYIGAIIEVFSHRFIITGADLNVYRYMQANPEKFPSEVMDNMRNYMFNEGFLSDDLQDEMNKNAEIQRKKDIDKIGAELKVIKTEREKCLELIEQNAAQPPTETDQLDMVVDSQKLPYRRQICEYGIKEPSQVCPLPVTVTEKNLDEKLPCELSADSYVVKYPKTKEQELQEYYEDVLNRHEEACLKAAEYKRYHECLPGTVAKYPQDYHAELSKKVLVSKEDRPQPHKDSPCIKKKVRFIETPEVCEQTKEDICGLTVPTTKCDCTNYTPITN